MTSTRDRLGWILLILLTATVLRLYDINDIPPGMTHDEADHGVDAWGVVNGDRPIYFTVGYGREPLYDYSTAVLMSFMGPTYLAGRLTSVYFSLIMIAGMYSWVRLAIDRRTALLTAAGLAVGFWSLMVSRHALRSVTLPALFMLALLFYWSAYAARPELSARRRFGHYLLAGVFLGATFYTYIPSRILWLIFPALLLFLLVVDRAAFARAWRGVLLTLAVAALIAAPLVRFLVLNPEAEVRLNQLAGPVTAALDGDLAPLLANTLGGLATLTFTGDSQWRYNIAGQPFLPAVMGLLFYAGLALALYHVVVCMLRRQSLQAEQRVRAGAPLFLSLIWLILGLLPVLITGPELSTTQAVGMLPALYLFPALALVGAYEWLEPRTTRRLRRWAPLLALALFTVAGLRTAWAYFSVWANDPQVRLQYETTLVTMIRYLNETGGGPAAISSTTPDRFHDPATAAMTLTNPDVSLRWFNGQSSLLLAQDAVSRLVFSGQSALHPALLPFIAGAGLEATLPLRGDDVDRPITIYQIDGPAMLDTILPEFRGDNPSESANIDFGGRLALLGYRMSDGPVKAGESIQLATLWRIEQPVSEEAVLFTHIIGPDGLPVAQADRLDVPSYYWHAGDVFVQLHEIVLPADLPLGNYTVAMGIYSRPGGARWPVTIDGQPAGDILPLTEVVVSR